MPIEFRCPQCQKLLRVPSESAGAKAKCPQCNAIADIPQSEGASPSDQEGPADLSAGQAENPFTESARSSQPSSESASDERVNPYSTPVSGYEPVGFKTSASGEVVPTPVDAGSVISYAWEVWKSNLGLLLGVTAIVFGANIGFSAAQGGVEAIFQQQDQPAVGSLIGGLISIVSSVVQIFLGIGQAQIVLKLLRRQPAEFGDLFGGGPLFLSVFGASLLAGLAMFLGVLACIVPGILLAIYFWSFYWLLVDGKATVIESFGMAQSLGKPNAGTTIVLWLASFGIMLVGILAFCVGIIFAAPLVSLIWGAAYLMMSGQLTPNAQY